MKDELMDDGPPGAIGHCTESGYIDMNLFLKYLNHFVSHVRCTKDDKVLLILDGHSSHTRSIQVIDYARENGIILLSLPPHTTHKLQPLAVSVFKAVETYNDEAITKWLRNHPGRAVTPWQVAGIFKDAYARAANIQNAVNGFRCTGIMPYDPNILPENVLSASQTTNILQPAPDLENDENEETDVVEHVITSGSDNHAARTTCLSPDAPSKPKELPSVVVSPNVSFEEILPQPKVSQMTNRKRKASRAEVLTSSPYKKKLAENKKTRQKKKDVDRRCTSDLRGKQIAQTGNKVSKATSPKFGNDGKDKVDCICLVCGEFYHDSLPGEQWIQCLECKDWAHEDCANVMNAEYYVCDNCEI